MEWSNEAANPITGYRYRMLCVAFTKSTGIVSSGKTRLCAACSSPIQAVFIGGAHASTQSVHDGQGPCAGHRGSGYGTCARRIPRNAGTDTNAGAGRQTVEPRCGDVCRGAVPSRQHWISVPAVRWRVLPWLSAELTQTEQRAESREQRSRTKTKGAGPKSLRLLFALSSSL